MVNDTRFIEATPNDKKKDRIAPVSLFFVSVFTLKISAWKVSHFAKLFFDANQLIVFGHPVGT
jgi:hypothetical protein